MFQSFPKPEEQKLFSWKRSFCRRSFNLAAVSMAVPTFAASPIWPILWKRKARWMTTELSEARRYCTALHQGCAGRIISKPGIWEPWIANSPTPPSECLGSSACRKSQFDWIHLPHLAYCKAHRHCTRAHSERSALGGEALKQSRHTRVDLTLTDLSIATAMIKIMIFDK